MQAPDEQSRRRYAFASNATACASGGSLPEGGVRISGARYNFGTALSSMAFQDSNSITRVSSL
jgi:hypothetical protein